MLLPHGGASAAFRISERETQLNTTRVLERAFELARSGRCPNLDDLRRRLQQEGYHGVEEHLRGTTLRRQLRALIQDAAPKAQTISEGTQPERLG